MSPEFDSLLPTFVFKDFPSPFLGDQKWKGAALTLNKNPILNISKEKLIYKGLYHKSVLSLMLVIAYKASKLVVPEFAYNKLVPNKWTRKAALLPSYSPFPEPYVIVSHHTALQNKY